VLCCAVLCCAVLCCAVHVYHVRFKLMTSRCTLQPRWVRRPSPTGGSRTAGANTWQVGRRHAVLCCAVRSLLATCFLCACAAYIAQASSGAVTESCKMVCCLICTLLLATVHAHGVLCVLYMLAPAHNLVGVMLLSGCQICSTGPRGVRVTTRSRAHRRCHVHAGPRGAAGRWCLTSSWSWVSRALSLGGAHHRG
jgi:hypothetical protein